jgi:hypothetical protein
LLDLWIFGLMGPDMRHTSVAPFATEYAAPTELEILVGSVFYKYFTPTELPLSDCAVTEATESRT